MYSAHDVLISHSWNFFNSANVFTFTQSEIFITTKPLKFQCPVLIPANGPDIGSFEPKEKDLEGKDNPKEDHGNEKRRSSEEQFDHDHNENGQEVDEKSSTAAVALDLKTRSTMDLQAVISYLPPPPPVDLQDGMR